MKKPKILLSTAIYIGKSYCLFDWIDHIKALLYPDVDIFLVDNSRTESFSKKINDIDGVQCVWENPAGRESRYAMTASMERCRVKFLAGDYDYFLSLECDIFPPVDIIERLMHHDLPIVSGIYFTDHGYNTKFQLLTIENIVGTKYSTRYLSFNECMMFINGTVKPMYANGIGCALIERKILEKFRFRIDPLDIGHADSFFHQDLWKAGILNMIDTSIIVTHRNSNWNVVTGDKGNKMLGVKKGRMQIVK